ncbi:amidohydrolase family protein [Gordonia malaquae]|uniref:amidohydrolase family protein n=1 Tax=Gordonia malaquae TaxID=410332 RepID=UPI0030FEF57D
MTRRLFDAHLHIVDLRFPLVENSGYLPPPFTTADYMSRVGDLGVQGGAVVSGSFQAFDQAYLLDALASLPGEFVGVTQIPADTPDARIVELDGLGVRAVRFNVRRGGSASLDELESLACRVHALVGWHSELYIDSNDLAALAPTLRRLPAISIDHLGLSADGFTDVLRLVDSGIRVKATGFGRVELDPVTAMRAIVDVDPGALMVGTDLPSTRAPRPFVDSDLDLVHEAVGDGLIDDVLWSNAARWYRVVGR